MRVIIFALMSGIISGLVFDADLDGSYVAGVLFAAAVIAGSYSRYRSVGLLRMAGFAAMSTAAYHLAVQSALGVTRLDSMPMGVAGAAAGLVGSAVLALAFRVFFRAKPFGRLFLAFTAAGIAAGVAFFYLPHPVLGFAVWQGAVAVVIARHWSRDRV